MCVLCVLCRHLCAGCIAGVWLRGLGAGGAHRLQGQVHAHDEVNKGTCCCGFGQASVSSFQASSAAFYSSFCSLLVFCCCSFHRSSLRASYHSCCKRYFLLPSLIVFMRSQVGLDLITSPVKSPRKTKIVCTLGPACWSEEGLSALIDAGMNVARFNFSHGDHAGHLQVLERVRQVRLPSDSGNRLRAGRLDCLSAVLVQAGNHQRHELFLHECRSAFSGLL